MVRNFGAKIAFFTLKIEYRMVKNLGAKNALFQVSLYKGRPSGAFIKNYYFQDFHFSFA